ncbi:MAG: site-specific integrase [Candidatus Nanoarchaeia archaeon]|nr:site-specific integrase [Candidatus Nanoarchaeia archaeon]
MVDRYIDPHNFEERYNKWRNKINSIDGICKKDSDLILTYLDDMSQGMNVAIGHSKGSRSFTRLMTLRTRIPQIIRLLEKHLEINSITQATERDLSKLFTMMRTGAIGKDNGGKYKSTRDFVKDLKSFWHWYQKYIFETKNKHLLDITLSLDTSKDEKPKWVWIKQEDLEKLANNSTQYKYKVMLYLLFESGIRAPSELFNVKVKDLIFKEDFALLHVRYSKTFERKIKLFFSISVLKGWINSQNLKPEDHLFNLSAGKTNQYLKRLGKRVLGKEFTMYDLRHSSAVYWLPRCKTESAMMYRFGWKKADKIFYYSEFLGMRDTTQQEDLYVDTTKTELENEITKEKQKREMLESQMEDMNKQILLMKKAFVGFAKSLPKENRTKILKEHILN